MILLIFFAIIAGAVYKKINVFDAFIDGAKEGFNVCVKIIPYLVGMLIAISLLRTSGSGRLACLSERMDAGGQNSLRCFCQEILSG
jgi:spore maturation protein SpmB